MLIFYPVLPAPMQRADYLMKAVIQPAASAGFDRSEVPTPVKFKEISVSPSLEALLAEYNTKKEHGSHIGESMFAFLAKEN